MATRIEFTGTCVVYDDDDMENPQGWVRAAMLYGDKHAGDYSLNLIEVIGVSPTDDTD